MIRKLGGVAVKKRPLLHEKGIDVHIDPNPDLFL
jgi:hypothetical protein